jgi:hypothetical protein
MVQNSGGSGWRGACVRQEAAMFWCLGMFSSASTWTFNVVRQIAASVSPDGPASAVFLDFDDPLPAGDATLIVKTHGTKVARELGRRAEGIVITLRDPRDAVVSLIQSNKLPFEVALRMTEVSAWTCVPFMRHPRAVMFRFEDRFFEEPSTVGRIAALFPGVLPEGESARIFAALGRDAVDAFIADMERQPTTRTAFNPVTGEHDVVNVATGWHRHHGGRSGEVGRWRRGLTAAQLQAIEQRMRPWMERVGYDSPASRGAPYRLSFGRYGVVHP